MTARPTKDRHSDANPRFGWLDPQLAGRVPRYFVQSLLAAVALGAILAFEDVLTHGAIVVAIAASTALTFFAPHSVAASARRMVGGHVMGVIAAGIAWAIFSLCYADPSSAGTWAVIVTRAGGVGLAILLMTVTNTEHAPAAGTALGLVTDGFPVQEIAFILSAVVLLSLVRLVLLRRLENLM